MDYFQLPGHIPTINRHLKDIGKWATEDLLPFIQNMGQYFVMTWKYIFLQPTNLILDYLPGDDQNHQIAVHHSRDRLVWKGNSRQNYR